MSAQPQFSVLHSSARPHAWQAVHEDWMSKAVNPERVEYVLCMDKRWGFTSQDARDAQELGIVVVENSGRRCYVDGVNCAAAASSGQILIVNADDQFACDRWDERIPIAFPNLSQVVEVATGTPNEHERGILVMPVLTKARYEQQGCYVFYPAYESMYVDNDFCEWARRDGIVIDARHLMFPHRHWIDGKRKSDEQDAAQNSKAAFELGQRILEARRRNGFVPVVESKPRVVAFCLPGQVFQGEWVDGLIALYGHVKSLGYDVIYLRNYTSNVYVTREEIRLALLACEPKPDLALWLDDDNLCSPQHFDMLFKGIEAHPEIDGVLGWCWIHNDAKTGFRPSCGMFAPNFSEWRPFAPSFEKQQSLRPVEASGFPCSLFRLSAFEKAGERPFIRGILDPKLSHGIGGEDFAFFRAAQEGGASFLVDPRVRVPHLKYVTVEPITQDEGKDPVRIAVMMRVKNEGRWIGRVIASVKELGTVYVMDDGSTDDTREIVYASGACLLASPFAGEPLDEARDKNWLLAQVEAADHPDWVLCIDGDEELEPGGVEKIGRACESGVADCFTMRFLYLWDKPNQARFDRWYSSFSRLSLFRVMPELSFRSLYAEFNVNVHSGLHTGNAPVAPQGEQAHIVGGALNVFLLHYGYMLKEDRIRKYEYYNRIDPDNRIEDCYRHIVQGDIPEVPADAVLVHAGPLELRKLPKSIAPDFDLERISCQTY